MVVYQPSKQNSSIKFLLVYNCKIVEKTLFNVDRIISYCSFPVDKSVLEKHFLEGQTFDDCLTKDKLFYVNYKDLEGYITPDAKIPMVCPIALFYSRMDGVSIPLAIQLYQTSTTENPNPVSNNAFVKFFLLS